MDADSKAALEKIKNGAVATLQTTQTLERKFQEADGLARKFQSEADRLKKATEKPKEDVTDPYVKAVNEELVGAGYSPEDATKLAPVFAGMFKKVGAIQTTELGKSLAPMAQTVLAGQATDAWALAQQNDALGMFQIPEVSQGVWDIVRERVERGEETTPEIILNLGKMAWADHEAAQRAGGSGGGGSGGGTGEPPRGILPTAPPTMRTGGHFSYPGAANFTPIARQVADPNAPKTELNADTRAALAATFRTMTSGTGIVPKELKDVIHHTGRPGARK